MITEIIDDEEGSSSKVEDVIVNDKSLDLLLNTLIIIDVPLSYKLHLSSLRKT